MQRLNRLLKPAAVLSACLLAAAIAAPAQRFATLHSFNRKDGASPNAALVQAADGNLYGPAEGGVASSYCGPFGCGTIFKTSPSGKLTTLYRFCSQSSCSDGGNLAAALLQATDGNFYGTTVGGGSNNVGTL